MAIRAFLSHSSVDKPFVIEVKNLLEQGGDIACWLDDFEISPGQNIVSRINDGLAKSDFVLLFLSPTALKSRWVEEEWTTALWTQTNSGETRLIPVLLGDVLLPAILENKKYVDLRTNQLEGIRKLKADLLRSRPNPVGARYTAASLPNFTGRETELNELRDRLSQPGSLVPIVGMPGLGKTFLAREFIRRHGALFDAVYELDCEKKDLAALTGELAAQLGLRLDGDADHVARELRRHLTAKRCLLLLDNVDDEQPGALLPEGRSSVVVTSRNPAISFFADYQELRPPFFTDLEALDLFQRAAGKVAESQAKLLFERLGHLPIAIAVSAGLIRHDVRYTVASLLASFPPLDKIASGKNNLGRLLGSAISALNVEERTLLSAIAVCAPGGVKLEFAAEVARLSAQAALEALQGLHLRSLVIELDRAARRYRLHALIRDAANVTEAVRQKHAQMVLDHLRIYEKAPLQSADFVEEATQALSTLDENAASGASIAILAGNLCNALSRLPEALDFYLRLQDRAMAAQRQDWLQASYGNQAVILQDWGRLEEAMPLHQKQEVICQELGDRSGLQASYGNQALILQAWGRLEEAMALHKKEEAICQELGDRSGLGRSYGNQALILKAWGRLDEAMALHKKQEAICRELGDRSGLQASYGNQALILQAWGQLDEAMALHKQEEAICQELGDRSGLQRSYGNQALILKAWGQLHEAMALHKKQEAICQELGDRSGLQRSYGGQALILKAWGQLEEAMALHKKQEAICQELGDRSGLQRSYSGQALILQAWGRLEEAMALLKKQGAICQKLSDRSGLQRSYGNQALILQAWGRLEEAVALHKKQEAICQELGDRSGLQASYGNQALILQAWGQLDEAIALHKKEEAICQELGDRSGLQRSYGNQALILKAWGRLEEAMALLKNQEVICRELGDRSGLAYSYANQGFLADLQHDSATALAKLNAALATFTELKMPRERDAVARALSERGPNS